MDLNDLKTAGRIFYELKFYDADSQLDIRTLYYHGTIEIDTKFPLKNTSSNILFFILFGIVISFIIFILLFKKKNLLINIMLN